MAVAGKRKRIVKSIVWQKQRGVGGIFVHCTILEANLGGVERAGRKGAEGAEIRSVKGGEEGEGSDSSDSSHQIRAKAHGLSLSTLFHRKIHVYSPRQPLFLKELTSK